MTIKELINRLEGYAPDYDPQIVEAHLQAEIDALNEKLNVLPAPTVPPTPVSPTVPTLGSPLQNVTLYVNPNSESAKAAEKNAALKRISDQPTAIWLTGGTEQEVYKQVKSVVTQAYPNLVTFVVYNIPHRDNGGQSSGGAADQNAYEAWIGAIDAAVKDAGNPKVVFIMEPDALGFNKDNYPALASIKIAIDILNQHPNRTIYLDVPMWDSTPDSMEKVITFLKEQDKMTGVRGWSLNTSGYNLDEKCQTFGEALVQKVGGHYIVDTSRNAKGGVPGQWENVPGQGLGANPLTQPATATFDGNLWIKPPGESDGSDNGHPNAGQFDEAYALELIKNAK